MYKQLDKVAYVSKFNHSCFHFQSPSDAHSAWAPRVDGVFILDTPEALLEAGIFAHVPLMSGTMSYLTTRESGIAHSVYELQTTAGRVRRTSSHAHETRPSHPTVYWYYSPGHCCCSHTVDARHTRHTLAYCFHVMPIHNKQTHTSHTQSHWWLKVYNRWFRHHTYAALL